MEEQVPAADDLGPPPAWALERVPGLHRGIAPRELAALHGGSVNRVYLVESAAGRFVLRLDGAAWRRPGVDRHRELLLHRAAAAVGLAPPIVHAAPEADGLLITQYCAGRVWTAADFGAARTLRLLGERLYVLHRLPAPSIPAFDPWGIVLAYVQSIEARQDGWQGGARPIAELARLERCCALLGAPAAGGAAGIVHGDLAAGNLLQGERLWLLDWEYAQRAQPLLDLACVLAYHPQASPHGREFAAACGLARGERDELLPEAIYLYRALSWLWQLARGESARAP